MLLSFPHFPSSHQFCSKTPHNLSRPSPSFLQSSTLCLKNQKSHTPHCRTPSSSHASSSQEAAARSAIQRISEKLRSLGYLPDDPAAAAADPPTPIVPGSAGEIFIPTPHEIPKRRVGHTIDPSWSTPERPVPEPGSGTTITRFRELWKREQETSTAERKEVKMPTVAELILPRKELKRLRTLGIALTKRLKVGKAGITEGIVNGIHERWRRSEVVKIKCDDLCRMNMKRTHEILERKTGGLVVWRSGNIIVLYRGTSYEYPYFHIREHNTDNLDKDFSDMEQGSSSSPTNTAHTSVELSGSKVHSPSVSGVGSPYKLRFQLPGEIQLEEEADRLLDGLGPRFTDWWGYDPLPVDGDFLPAIVPEFRKPFRLLPFGLKPKLTDRELAILRRLSRHLPCHYALGRNRNLQGLAVSIIKLWEKCEVAKIAVKRSAQNTNSAMMAEELKNLTGGTLLSRDKDFIVFYRGKDYLPPAISVAIEERRNLKSGDRIQSKNKVSHFVKTQSSRVGFTNSSSDMEPGEAAEQKRSLVVLRNAKSTSSSTMRKLEAKLKMVTEKIERSKKHLVGIEKLIEPSMGELDKEGISKEERYMLRRVGLRMKPFLLLGRRGVFDGTIENMHLHWKYRELVKIIHKDWCIENVESDARTLEAESGGILVAVERVSKGHAIVIYRGKNYWRPINLRPKSLLNKKEALKRSLESQRSESLKLHSLGLSTTINEWNHQTANNDLDTDTSCLSEFEESRSNSSNEISDKIGPLQMEENSGFAPEVETNRFAQFHFNGEHIEEVNEVNAAGYSNIPSNMETVIAPNLDNVIFSEHQYEFPETESLNSTSVSISEREYIDDSCTFDANLFSGQAQSLPGPSSLESNFEQESDVEYFFRPAPLSNRERLLLRKQALKMKKRPVLAVGRNNILTGVAKTIKTHFKKHPLAIVNIKGRAKGTSVQELVFELEQETESVLVSREPNKVILYRGWGEGDKPGGLKKKDVKKASMEAKNGVVSPHLIAAIRRECGLPIADAQ